MSSLTKTQIAVIRSMMGFHSIGGMDIHKVHRAIRGLKKRGLITPKGKLTRGAIERVNKYLERKKSSGATNKNNR